MMRISCTECGQKSEDGVLQHRKSCSANMLKPIKGIGQTMPGQTITFDTPEEAKKFTDRLGKTTGSDMVAWDYEPPKSYSKPPKHSCTAEIIAELERVKESLTDEANEDRVGDTEDYLTLRIKYHKAKETQL